MRIEPEISGVSVVLLGSFNPAIFTPAWFALHEILPKGVADNAELHVAHPDLTAFSTEWLNLEVKPDRFQAHTQRDPYVRVCDLLVRVFKEHLPHTPLRAFGINRDVLFPVASQAEQARIGKLLAPAARWGRWKDELGLDGDDGGMTSLTMSQLRPAGRPYGGEVNVRIEPFKRIADGRSGIHVRVNDHYAAGGDDIESREKLMGVLEKDFESSLQRSDAIIDHIMSLSREREGEGS